MENDIKDFSSKEIGEGKLMQEGFNINESNEFLNQTAQEQVAYILGLSQ